MSGLLTKTCFFRCGDEIVEVNDVVVYNMALNDVYTVLSQCTPGPVHIIVSRHPNPKVWLPALHTCIHNDNEIKKYIKSSFFFHSFESLSFIRVKFCLYFHITVMEYRHWQALMTLIVTLGSVCRRSPNSSLMMPLLRQWKTANWKGIKASGASIVSYSLSSNSCSKTFSHLWENTLNLCMGLTSGGTGSLHFSHSTTWFAHDEFCNQSLTQWITDRKREYILLFIIIIIIIIIVIVVGQACTDRSLTVRRDARLVWTGGSVSCQSSEHRRRWFAPAATTPPAPTTTRASSVFTTLVWCHQLEFTVQTHPR